MQPDVEVVFDLPTGEHGPRYVVADDLDVEVRRMREAVVLSSREWDRRGGSAAEAMELLEAHRTAREGVLISALLVCTDRRFERCSRTLMRRFDADDLLDADHLDVLAVLLFAEDRVRFAIPSTWLSTSLEVPPGTVVRSSGYELVPVGDDEQTFPHMQRIPAAARRWAARRLLEGGLITVEAVLERIGGLRDAGAGGAVLSGVLDAWTACPPDGLQRAVDTALASGLASVRLRALDVLACTGRADEAVARARGDGATAVRAWQPPAEAEAEAEADASTPA